MKTILHRIKELVTFGPKRKKKIMETKCTAMQAAEELIRLADIDSVSGGDLMTNLKLQKLLYYEQGFHLATFGKPLFPEPVEAWIYGPAVPPVYEKYRPFGQNALPSPENGKEFPLKDAELQLFNEVYETYKDYSAIGLMKMTHEESPWKKAAVHNRGAIISTDEMKNFFKTKIEEQCIIF